MNKAILLGNLGKDPDLTTTQSGKMVAKFSLGVADGYGDKKSTSWHNIVCWEKVAESVGNNLLKGSNVLVEGKITNRSYDGKDGQKKYITEIVANHVEFLTPKRQHDANDPASQFGQDVAPDDEITF